jgi:hypothetical protein
MVVCEDTNHGINASLIGDFKIALVQDIRISGWQDYGVTPPPVPVPNDENIAPIGAGCRAARKAGRLLNDEMMMRFEKINTILPPSLLRRGTNARRRCKLTLRGQS